MLLATDVYYYEDNTATAAGVLFESWSSQTPVKELSTVIESVAAYEPGNFYKRELPCLLALVAHLQKTGVTPSLIIVDGFVNLGLEQRKGLGAYLYEALHEAIPVVGVAKTGFHETPEACALLRGKSTKPLFVTAAGMDLAAAKNAVYTMHGEYRLPTMLTRVDQLCRVPRTANILPLHP